MARCSRVMSASPYEGTRTFGGRYLRTGSSKLTSPLRTKSANKDEVKTFVTEPIS